MTTVLACTAYAAVTFIVALLVATAVCAVVAVWLRRRGVSER